MSLCKHCRKANDDCPIYPADVTFCAEFDATDPQRGADDFKRGYSAGYKQALTDVKNILPLVRPKQAG